MSALAWAIFGLGAALSVAWMLFLIFGHKSGDADGAQTLEFKGLKLGLGSSVWVMTLSVVLAVLPMIVTRWPAPTVNCQAQCPSPDRVCPALPPPSQNVNFHVSGTVLDCSGRVLGGARVQATDRDGKVVFDRVVADDGSYAFPVVLKLGDSNDSLTVTTNKNTYRPQQFVLYANAVNFQPVLAGP